MHIEELALRASGLGVWVLDLVSAEFRTCDRFREILGHNAASTDMPPDRPPDRTQDWSDLFALAHEDDRDSLYDGIAAQLTGMWPLDLELRLCPSGRDYRWYRIAGNAHLTDDGNPLLIAGTLEDVNERREADEAIRNSEASLRQLTEKMHESEERFRQLAEHMEDMFWLEDTATGAAIYVNSALTRLLPVSHFDFTKNPRACWQEISHPDDSLLAGAFVAPSEDSKSEATFRISSGDGSTRWIHARTFPILDAGGRTYRVAGIAQDVTEARRSQDQLRDSQKLEAIGQLAAGIAHEINTPTQFVGDNTRFLEECFRDLIPVLQRAEELAKSVREHNPGSELADALFKAIQDADVDYLRLEIPRAIEQSLGGIDRVRKLVQSMKEFSHPGVDGMTSVDLNRAIESTIVVASNEWKYVAEMETDFAADLPTVTCLTGEINQVVLNMIVNAAHAIADVIGDGSDKGTIKIATRQIDDMAEIRISDSGTGIPESVQRKIFDPFFTTKEVGRGTGQGLSIAHSVVVSKHAGTLDFETETGKGTTFIVRIPIAGVRSEGEEES